MIAAAKKLKDCQDYFAASRIQAACWVANIGREKSSTFEQKTNA
jgi:hypothetical protein